jgi:phosphate transport system protein
MGGLVERQISDALTALRDQNTELADFVIRTDHRVNALEVGIDEDSTYILARRQPAAGDLRTVMAIIKTITDLERVGDESEKIAKMVLGKPLTEVPGVNSLIKDIEAMGSMVSEILRAALDSFVRLDVQAAFNTASMDGKIDEAYGALLGRLYQNIKDAPDEVEYYQRLIWITRSLERIGDHSKNICEYVVYLARGKDVRHISIEEGKKELQME